MPTALDEALSRRFAAAACGALGREFPNHITHFLNEAADARPPRALHPAFYGALDWHSAVHNHWLLARLIRLFPDADFAPQARAILEEHLTPARIKAECDYFRAPGREPFERPYGWAWLLVLDAELEAFPAERAALAPLTALIAERIPAWLGVMPCPVRSGEHANSAFSLALMLDWARNVGDDKLIDEIQAASLRFYADDRGATFAFEPSGQDFVSPALAEAALMARIVAPDAFADWLAGFLPGDELRDLQPATAPENGDYKLAHLGGLHLSRAWMLAEIERRLPDGNPRRDSLRTVMMLHQEAGLAAARREDYGASHWIPSFAVYHLSH
ncbi:MAG: DUF2891 domain-containing protein [Gammaproteobacteria bacterium]|nr:DUF2891 domain-containing protein [Gammaproteobacteria bacterium]